MQRRGAAFEAIKANLEKVSSRMNFFAKNHWTERSCEVGDMVYLKMQPYRHNALGLHKTLKLHSKFYGPYRIIEKIGQVAYKLLLPVGCQIHPVLHVSQLKRRVGHKVIPSKELPLVNHEGNILTEPIAVLERRVVPRNNEPVVQWRVQWANLPPEAATWEDPDFITRIFQQFNP